MADIPQEALTAAAVAIHDADCPDTHCSGAALGHAYRLANAALTAAGSVIRVQEAAAERARILAAAREAAFTLFRPGPGRGEAHGQAMEVVPLEALVALLGDAG